MTEKRASSAEGDHRRQRCRAVVGRSLAGKPARMIRNKWADAWVQAGKGLCRCLSVDDLRPVMASGIKTGKDVILRGARHRPDRFDQPAAEVMRDLVDGAEKALASAGIYRVSAGGKKMAYAKGHDCAAP